MIPRYHVLWDFFMPKDKGSIRKKMIEMRENGLSFRERKEWSSHLASLLINDLLLETSVNSVGLYYPIKGEVDTFPIFDFLVSRNTTCLFPRVVSDVEMVFLPVSSRRELVRRKFGVYEPDVGFYTGLEGSVPDIVVVPGVAFDRKNHRIGYGKGFYDRYLTKHKPLLKIGYGYAFQLLNTIDADLWDVKLDLVLTENGWQGDNKNIFAGGSR